MPGDLGHELHWSQTRGVLEDAGIPRDCDECQSARCAESVTITSKGDVVYGVPDMPGAVHWPGCPVQWACLRWAGQTPRVLTECLDWLVEIGAHRGDIGSGAADIYREHLLRRDLGKNLMEIRASEKAKS